MILETLAKLKLISNMYSNCVQTETAMIVNYPPWDRTMSHYCYYFVKFLVSYHDKLG